MNNSLTVNIVKNEIGEGIEPIGSYILLDFISAKEPPYKDKEFIVKAILLDLYTKKMIVEDIDNLELCELIR